MSFKPNIPQPGDFLSDSQVDLLNNNKALDAVYDRNHYKFSNNNATTQGKHKFVEMMNQGSIPSPAGGLANLSGTVYTKNVSGASDLFFINDDQNNPATAREYRLTNTVTNANAATAFPLLGTNTAITVGTGGWTWLGQGIILQYGLVNNPVDNMQITFPVPFVVNPYSIQLTPVITDNSTIRLSVLSGSVSSTKFNLNTSNGAPDPDFTSVYWIAIGSY